MTSLTRFATMTKLAIPPLFVIMILLLFWTLKSRVITNRDMSFFLWHLINHFQCLSNFLGTALGSIWLFWMWINLFMIKILITILLDYHKGFHCTTCNHVALSSCVNSVVLPFSMEGLASKVAQDPYHPQDVSMMWQDTLFLRLSPLGRLLCPLPWPRHVHQLQRDHERFIQVQGHLMLTFCNLIVKAWCDINWAIAPFSYYFNKVLTIHL